MSGMPAMSEAAWQRQVSELALLYGWRLYHPPDNLPRTTKRGRRYVQNVRAGFPDLVLVRPPELIFAELKTDRGRTSAEQDAWLEELGAVANALREVIEAYNFDLAHNDPELETRAAVDVYLWRPRDFDEVNERLGRGRDAVVMPAGAPLG